MKFRALLFLIAAGALLGSAAAPARTIIQAPQPDVRLFLPVPPAKLGELRRSLMNFAAQEHLSELRDVHAPRAQGKQFFLSLYSDKFSIIAEKTPGSRSTMIECTDLDSSYSRAQAQLLKVPYDTESPFGRMVIRLKERLKLISSDISEER